MNRCNKERDTHAAREREGGADGWCYWCFSGALNTRNMKGDTKEEKWGWGRGRGEGQLTDFPEEITNEIWPFILDFSSLVEIKQVVGRKTIVTGGRNLKQRRLCLSETKHHKQKASTIKLALLKLLWLTKSQEAAGTIAFEWGSTSCFVTISD